MELFHEVMAYKCSAVLLSASEMGLFDVLLGKTMGLKTLAEVTKTSPAVLDIFLNILMLYGVLEENENGFTISNNYLSQTLAMKTNHKILCHEKNLMNHWNTPNEILKQLKRGNNVDYIKDSFALEEQYDYFSVMNGKNLELLFAFIKREYHINSGTVLLEYGRSLGGMSIIGKNKYADMVCDICFEKAFEPVFNRLYGELGLKDGIRIVEENELLLSGYDFIFLYNTIHYYNPQNLKVLLEQLYLLLKPGQMLCISDIFPEENDTFYAGVLLDWMTHGGIYQQGIQELIEIIEKTRFRIIKTVTVKPLHNKLVLLTK